MDEARLQLVTFPSFSSPRARERDREEEEGTSASPPLRKKNLTGRPRNEKTLTVRPTFCHENSDGLSSLWRSRILSSCSLSVSASMKIGMSPSSRKPTGRKKEERNMRRLVTKKTLDSSRKTGSHFLDSSFSTFGNQSGIQPQGHTFTSLLFLFVKV